MISRRNFLNGGLALGAASALSSLPFAAASAAPLGPAVFFFPHQDDEILTQGPSIQAHLAAGREVICVSMSDGQASGVRGILRRDHGINLSEAAFSKARDREAIDCLTRLGVKQENIYFENLEDGTGGGLRRVKNIMRQYMREFPGGSYKTHSWMDVHIDHHTLGRALDELNRAGEVPNGDARFLRSFRYEDAPTPGGWWVEGVDGDAIKHAGEAYNVWAPNRLANAADMGSGPRYAIGYNSVGSAWFNETATRNKVWTHKDSSGYSARRRNAANDWLQSHGMTPYL